MWVEFWRKIHEKMNISPENVYKFSSFNEGELNEFFEQSKQQEVEKRKNSLKTKNRSISENCTNLSYAQNWVYGGEGKSIKSGKSSPFLLSKTVVKCDSFFSFDLVVSLFFSFLLKNRQIFNFPFFEWNNRASGERKIDPIFKDWLKPHNGKIYKNIAPTHISIKNL